jgi:hypothetical protein
MSREVSERYNRPNPAQFSLELPFDPAFAPNTAGNSALSRVVW